MSYINFDVFETRGSTGTSVADRHPDPAFHFDAAPDPTIHSDADPDPDPSFQFDANPDLPLTFSGFGPSNAPK